MRVLIITCLLFASAFAQTDGPDASPSLTAAECLAVYDACTMTFPTTLECINNMDLDTCCTNTENLVNCYPANCDPLWTADEQELIEFCQNDADLAPLPLDGGQDSTPCVSATICMDAAPFPGDTVTSQCNFYLSVDNCIDGQDLCEADYDFPEMWNEWVAFCRDEGPMPQSDFVESSYEGWMGDSTCQTDYDFCANQLTLPSACASNWELAECCEYVNLLKTCNPAGCPSPFTENEKGLIEFCTPECVSVSACVAAAPLPGPTTTSQCYYYVSVDNCLGAGDNLCDDYTLQADWDDWVDFCRDEGPMPGWDGSDYIESSM